MLSRGKIRSTKKQPGRIPVNVMETDIWMGLSDEEIARRKSGGWDNRADESPAKSVREIIRDNVCTYFNLILEMLFPTVFKRMWKQRPCDAAINYGGTFCSHSGCLLYIYIAKYFDVLYGIGYTDRNCLRNHFPVNLVFHEIQKRNT